MKKTGVYLRNPGFGMIVSNPAKKKRRRNPAKRRRRKNPAASSPLSVRSATVKRSAAAHHHKKGAFVYNPAKRRKKRRVVKSSPAVTAAPSVTSPTMKKTRRGSRRRNPVRSHKKRRYRNPSSRRRRSVRYRNPVAVVSDVFNPNMLTAAAALTVGTVGTKIVMNKLLTGNAAGQRPFNLPGVDYTVPGNQFWAKNKWPILLYETAIPAVAGYFLRNQSPRFAQGLMLAATFNAVSGAVKNSGVLEQYGVGRYFGGDQPAPGVRAYTPGVPSIFTGPASGFIGGGVPTPRGTRAMVGPRFVAQAANAAPDPFGAS